MLKKIIKKEKMNQPLIECVPNFSEGRNLDTLDEIAKAITGIHGVHLLHIDRGEGANRTVFTFAGPPEVVVEAAFCAVRVAGELIDMRQHHGAHPRIGATDVLPLVPISGISLKECAELARQLARRISDELLIPCYCYEAAAFIESHRNLASCRSGEYEGLAAKLTTPGLAPDFGARPMDERIARTGSTVVGARDYLIAVNFNLDTIDTRLANAVAFDVREKGRPLRDEQGQKVLDDSGKPVMIPGTLKGTKALGWYIDEYGIAQVSMNITDIHATPLHTAYEDVCRCAEKRGLHVTGTEIIGLVPKQVLLDAGRHFLEKEQKSGDQDEKTLMDAAIRSIGLDDLRPFNAHEKVIEYMLERPEKPQI